MNESEKIVQMIELAESIFGPIETTLLGKYSPPFDIKRPNIHDSKKEFMRELGTVVKARDRLQGILDLLLVVPDDENSDPLQKVMVRRPSLAIETNIYQRGKNKFSESASELALQNLKETGFYHNSVLVILEMLIAFEQRLRDLKEQEIQFWTVANRAPNYYARVIALRFARFFCKSNRKASDLWNIQ